VIFLQANFLQVTFYKLTFYKLTFLQFNFFTSELLQVDEKLYRERAKVIGEWSDWRLKEKHSRQVLSSASAYIGALLGIRS
jgi:hypothetical protein